MAEVLKKVDSRRIHLDWLGILIGIMTIWNVLPFIAPVFMKAGWNSLGEAIYYFYSFSCHQMAQRSFFLFGPNNFQMYNIAELPVAWEAMSEGQMTLAFRAFRGSDAMGWKVAWSDRMTSMYLSPLIFAIAYAFIRRRRRIDPFPLWVFLLLMLPMALDGGTHMLSDFSGGLLGGFRYENIWLAELTGYTFGDSFYAGDGLGSFNSWMRILSGICFGLGLSGLLYPSLEKEVSPAYSSSITESTT